MRVRFTALIFTLITGSALAQTPAGDPPWTTSFGKMTWTSASHADYGSDEGRLIGSLSGRKFSGHWVEKGSARKCETAKDGSFYWGMIQLDFDDGFTGFTGSWGYCSEGTPSEWNGSRPIPGPKGKGRVPVAVILPCNDLEDRTRRLAADVESAHRDWIAFEQDYLSFYDDSKFELSADFDKVYYEMPGYVPFSNTINTIVKIEKDQRLRHFPQIKITAPPDYQNSAMAVLATMAEHTGFAGELGAAAGNVIANIGIWNAFMGEGRREKVLPYDEGLKMFREMMTERQGTLDNYRIVMDHMLCNKVVKLEDKLFTLRTDTIPRSSCPANVKEALTGFAARPARYGNDPQFQTVINHCAAKMN